MQENLQQLVSCASVCSLPTFHLEASTSDVSHSSTGETLRKSFKLLINDGSDDDSFTDLMGNDYTDKLEWPIKMELEDAVYENETVYKEEPDSYIQTSEVSNPSYLSLMVNNTPPPMFQDDPLQQVDAIPKVEDIAPVMDAPVGAKKPMPSCNGYHLYQKEIGAVIANMPTINPISPTADQRYDKISTLSRLTSHRWKHLPPEQKQEYAKRAQHLRDTIDSGFMKTDIFYCSRCPKTFKREKDLKYHEKECGPHKCGDCGKEFADGVLFQKHCKIHTNKYKCEICQKRFSAANSLKRHLEHHQNISYPCEKCTQKFTAKTNLSRHMKNIHKVS